LEDIARRFSTVELAPQNDAGVNDLEYEPSFMLRGLKRLHLTFGAN